MESEPVAPLPTLRADAHAHQQRQVQLGYLFAATGAILFSTKAVLVKLAYGHGVDAETLLALRMAFSLPFYFVIGALALRDRKLRGAPLPARGLVLRGALIGLLGYWFASYTDFLGLEYISAQFERLILFTYPLFVVLLGALFFGHRIERRAVVAFAVSYGGLALIFSENFSFGGRNVALGAGFVLAAAISFALYQLLAKVAIEKTGPRLFTCIAMSGAALGAFIQFFLTHEPGALLVSGPVLIYAVLIAVFATVLPSFFLSAALHRISAQANGAIGTLSPLATIIMAALVLGESLSPLGWLGTGLVLAGVGWMTLSPKVR